MPMDSTIYTAMFGNGCRIVILTLYEGAPGNGKAREGGDCKYRVLRGGSWGIKPGYLRSPHRLRHTATTRFDNNGFRLALDSQ